METRIIDAKAHFDSAVKQSAALIKSGEVVVFPTETVYGLGANALDEGAVQKIFTAKGRPQDNPLIVHIAQLGQLEQAVSFVPPVARRLAERFWPGPLSMILKKSDAIPDTVSAGLDTVAVRMPKSPVALAIIKEAGLPVAAPSANTSGRPSPTLARHAYEDLRGRVPLIVDGGPCEMGVESTVLDLTAQVPLILRPGGVTAEMIADAAGDVRVHESVLGKVPSAGAYASPGMRHRHYSPRARVELFGGNQKDIEKNIKSMYDLSEVNGIGPVIFCADESAALYTGKNVIKLGSGEAQVAASLYKSLREADEKGYGIILFHAKEEMGMAVLNRIIRAAQSAGTQE